MHLVIHKVFLHLKFSHMPISHIDFSDVEDKLFRSELLGTTLQQKDRLTRLFWLVKEMPKPPPVPKYGPHFTF